MKYLVGVFGAAVVLLGSWCAEATVLVSEGCNTTSDYAYVTADGKQLLNFYPKAFNASVGLAGQKWCGYGSQPRTYLYNLPLPECFADTACASKGAACVGMNRGSNATDHRWAYLQLASDVLKAESGTTLYFRGLINIDKGAASMLTKPSSNTIGSGNSFGFGLSTRPSSYGQSGGTPLNAPNALNFMYWKTTSGSLVLSVRVKDASGATTSKRLIDGLTAPTASGIAADNTYICYAEIRVGAGTDGKEIIRAGAVKVNDFNPLSLAWSDEFEAELISDTAYPTFLNIVGDYCVNGWAAMDEFVVATDIFEALAVNAEAPQFDLSNTGLSACKQDGTFDLTIGLAKNSAVVKAVARTSAGDESPVVISSGEAVAEGSVTTLNLAGLAADATYQILAVAENAAASVTNRIGTLYNGTLALAKVRDAYEFGRVAGEVTVSRAAADAYPVTVNYSLSSANEQAEEGVTWEAPGPVTIPAGETSATLTLKPKFDGNVTEDITVTLALTAGNYPPVAQTVDLTLFNFVTPAGMNYWVAKEAGLASADANWSLGHAPLATETVVFDGDCTSVNCEWDSAAAHTVAGWTQQANYSGTVQVDTTLDENAFGTLAVTGDVRIDGGTLAPKSHGTSTTATYLLRMSVGGDFAIGTGGTVSVKGLGRYVNNSTWGGSAAHGGDNGSMGTDSKTGKGWTNRWNTADLAYGDILNPMSVAHGTMSGTDSDSKKSHGGGLVRLLVAGDFTNDGVVNADGEKQYAASGAGGSINITAANIYGGGSYSSSVLAADKTDGTGAIGSGGRIALVATGDNEAANISCKGRIEGWGRRGAPGTVYLASAQGREIRVKGDDQYSWALNLTTTPIPAEGDTMDWWKCARDIDLVGSTSAHLRLTRERICVKSLSLLSSSANGKSGNDVIYRASDLDLAGKIIRLKSVIIDGTDLKLKAGDYTLADAAENGWLWLRDSSEGATGILRIYKSGLHILLR